MRLLLLSCWFLLVCQSIATAQTSADEWLERLEKAKTSREKLVILQNLASFYRQAGQYEMALPYYLRSERILEQAGEPEQVLDTKYEIGVLYTEWDIPKRAVEYFLRAYQGYAAIEQTEKARNALSRAAATYVKSGDLTKGIGHYQKLEKAQIEAGMPLAALVTQSKLADLYWKIKQNEESLKYHKRAVETARQVKDPQRIGVALNNLGFALRMEDQLEESRAQFEQALKAFDEAGVEKDIPERLITLNNLATLHQNMGNMDESLKTFGRLRDIYRKQGNEVALAETQHRIATTLLYGRLYQDALQPIDEAIELAIENNQTRLLARAYKTKSEILNELGEPRKALDLLELSNQIENQIKENENEAERARVSRSVLAQQAESQLELDLVAEEKKLLELDKLRSDSISKANEIQLLKERRINDSLKLAEQRRERERAQTELSLTQQRLANERKNQEIKDLQQQQQIQAFKLQQAELEEEQAQKAREAAEQRQKVAEQQQELEKVRRRDAERQNYFFIAIGLFFLFGFVLILFFLRKIQRNNRQLQTKNDQIMKQKEQIETQNGEINALLSQAKEKNEELLASEEELRQNSEELQAINENLEITSARLEKSLESEIESKQRLTETLDKLKSAQSQLVQSEKMSSLGQLTAGIAHEINNPINFINSGADSVQLNYQDILEILDMYAEITPENVEDKLSEIQDFKEEIDFEEVVEETTELIAGMKSGAERTAEIVKGLRTFSRLDESDIKKIKLEEGLDSTLVMLRNQYKDRITIHKDYGETAEIECYAGKLNQVFMNMLANAMQAIPDKGDIFLSTQMLDADHIQVRIRDTGTGMPEHVRERIFEPFFTTKDVGKGTGLGLSISFSIIEKHNGKLNVESEEGKGTEFIITLPVRHAGNT